MTANAKPGWLGGGLLAIGTLAARFEADVTGPDGAPLAAGTAFTQTWRLRNGGSRPWAITFTVYFDQGDHMDSPGNIHLPYAVDPSEAADARVNPRPPDAPGAYKGYGELRSDQGRAFGIGAEQRAAFWVAMRATAPAATATLANADLALPYDPANSDTLYEQGPPASRGPVMAGDTDTNRQVRGRLTCDLSHIPGMVTHAKVDLGCTQQLGAPFTELGGTWVAEVVFARPLRAGLYDPPGTPLTSPTALPTEPRVEVTQQVQPRLTAGDPEFHLRLHPQKPTDRDGSADAILCPRAVLRITYQP